MALLNDGTLLRRLVALPQRQPELAMSEPEPHRAAG